MARPVYGTRYISERNQRLREQIESGQVFNKDFQEIQGFYNEFNEKADPNDKALLACNDRYYLLVELLHRRDALQPWVYDRCREVEENPDGYLDLWARYHYKTSIITSAGIIQEICRDPEVTIAIFSGTLKIASKFFTQIQEELESNLELQQAFADVLYISPRTEAKRWSRSAGLVVKRKSNPKEATLECFGLVEGMPTGSHFKLLVYDDLVTVELVSNKDMVEKVTERWELSDNLGVGEKTRKWHVGTRYSYQDTYGTLLERKILKSRLYPATDTGLLDGTPVLMTPAAWEKVKMTQPGTVGAQMLQNPVAGHESTFRMEWLKNFEILPATLNIYIMGDPSKGRTRESDHTAIAVVAMDSAENMYLVDGFSHRMNLDERWMRLKELKRRWDHVPGVQSVRVGWEQYGLTTDIEHFQKMMRIEKDSWPIEELNWVREGRQSKEDRVQRLQPDFLQSRFYLPQVVWHEVNAGGGHAVWTVNVGTNKIEYRPLLNETKPQRMMKAAGQAWRIQEPITRKDEDGKLYDLTRRFIEQYLAFPKSRLRDLIDATSRVYDMQPVPPSVWEAAIEDEPVYYPDA